MKKTLILTAIVVIALIIICVYQTKILDERVGTYIELPCLDIVVCHNDYQCYHEKAHQYDIRYRNNVSQSNEYQTIAEFYFPRNGLTRDWAEFYANKYAEWKLGWIEMPEEMLQFYP